MVGGAREASSFRLTPPRGGGVPRLAPPSEASKSASGLTPRLNLPACVRRGAERTCDAGGTAVERTPRPCAAAARNGPSRSACNVRRSTDPQLSRCHRLAGSIQPRSGWKSGGGLLRRLGRRMISWDSLVGQLMLRGPQKCLGSFKNIEIC